MTRKELVGESLVWQSGSEVCQRYMEKLQDVERALCISTVTGSSSCHL
jgi:hypothetical protein